MIFENIDYKFHYKINIIKEMKKLQLEIFCGF
jgi:hypothetical protein